MMKFCDVFGGGGGVALCHTLSNVCVKSISKCYIGVRGGQVFIKNVFSNL